MKNPIKIMSKNVKMLGSALLALVTLLIFIMTPFSNVDINAAQPVLKVYALMIIIIFLTVGIGQAWKKKMTLFDYFTLQAKDEREQQLIDAAGRKTYALMRIVITIFGLLIVGGFTGKTEFSVNHIMLLTLFLIFTGEALFAYFTKRLQNKNKTPDA